MAFAAPMSTVSRPAFVRADRGRIVGPDGTPVLLRGVGLGTWLLPEGYMWGFGDAAASPRQIEALVADLIGEEDAHRFWQDFRDRFVTADDIAAIKAAGFDHVRLPINWRVVMTAEGDLIETGLALIDRLIEWCRAAGLFVLLDLHGAPGGQTGTNIDDSLGRPDLFFDPRYADLTEALWVALATRYRDDATVLGYDLLNEPLPHEWQHRFPNELVALYRRLTAAIRAVDPDHLIMYEGTHWATNWSIFTEVWDPNSALQFHRYWMAPERAAIGEYVRVGRELGLPVYMGEGGENTPQWLAAAHQLYEDHGIGWNLWTWKKIETLTSPLSVRAPRGWADVVAYAAGVGPRPPREKAAATFAQLLDNLAVDRCEPRPEIVAAAFRRAPVTLPAYGFTYRGPGFSYAVAEPAPHPGLRADDAVTLRRRDGRGDLYFGHDPEPDPGATVVADLADGDWLAFDVELAAGHWRLGMTREPGSAGRPEFAIDGVPTPRPTETADGWSTEVTRGDGGRAQVRVTARGGALVLAELVVSRL